MTAFDEAWYILKEDVAKKAAEIAGGWAGAWAGAKLGAAAGGASVGSLGTADAVGAEAEGEGGLAVAAVAAEFEQPLRDAVERAA